MKTLEERKAELKKQLAVDVFSPEFEAQFCEGLREGFEKAAARKETSQEFLSDWCLRAIRDSRK